MPGLDLALQGGKLRFFQGMAELFGTSDLIGRLTGMMGELEAKAEQATAKADQATAGVRETVLALLAARRIPSSDDDRDRVSSCDDLPTLQRWLLRATAADSAADVFGG